MTSVPCEWKINKYYNDIIDMLLEGASFYSAVNVEFDVE